MTDVLPHTHPVINGRVLTPYSTFVARNRVSGRCTTYTYSGSMHESVTGDRWVTAVDMRGHSRSVPVESIIRVRVTRGRAS